jgi:pimeloyl-ACP methyl ester carboxylesterase
VVRAFLLFSLVAIVLAGSGHASRLSLDPCTVNGVTARCGLLRVAENRAEPEGRKIWLNVVVIPARERPARPDAFTWLAGGPGDAATNMASSALSFWGEVHAHHDIVLVDQRGTGGSNALECPRTRTLGSVGALRAYVRSCLSNLAGDYAQYGTLTAVDDLEAVRIALGYRSFDVYGTSYGATAAQAYLNRYPHSVRTVVLDDGTLLGIPFYSRFAGNGARALDAVAARCRAAAACAAAYPNWRADLGRLIRAWSSKPVVLPGGGKIDGEGLAAVVQSLTLSSEGAGVIPYVVAHAAAGDLEPLSQHVGGRGPTRSIMYWSIWCNEPWVGLASRGPWHTYLDGSTRSNLALSQTVCSAFPPRAEPGAAWRRPHSNVPLLALVGGADPQDPLGNLTGLRRGMKNARIVVVPGMGHTVGQYGCLGALVSRFVDRGGAKALDTSCVRSISPQPFLVDA